MPESSLALALVEDMPTNLEAGILYVSEEYEIACHRCACGCGTPVYTPLGPTEWRFFNDGGVPSLKPSIGNWTLPCRSHYWILRGRIVWAGAWTDEQVRMGREVEQLRRERHYGSTSAPPNRWSLGASLKRLIDRIFRH